MNSDDLKVALTRRAEDLKMSFESNKSTLRTSFRFWAWGTRGTMVPFSEVAKSETGVQGVVCWGQDVSSFEIPIQ